MIVHMARVSSDPSWASRPDIDLIRYCVNNGHWSIFNMANLCFEAYTNRTIGRQLLRHSSITPQEFSQRYANVELAGSSIRSTARVAHPTNRQQSIASDDPVLLDYWATTQDRVWNFCVREYHLALERGLAKELARDLLPEGLTPTRMFFNGRIRDLLHLCRVRRLSEGAQYEAALVSDSLRGLLKETTPTVYSAFFDKGGIGYAD
jgi:thymidylate synthase (FAD)